MWKIRFILLLILNDELNIKVTGQVVWRRKGVPHRAKTNTTWNSPGLNSIGSQRSRVILSTTTTDTPLDLTEDQTLDNITVQTSQSATGAVSNDVTDSTTLTEPTPDTTNTSDITEEDLKPNDAYTTENTTPGTDNADQTEETIAMFDTTETPDVMETTYKTMEDFTTYADITETSNFDDNDTHQTTNTNDPDEDLNDVTTVGQTTAEMLTVYPNIAFLTLPPENNQISDSLTPKLLFDLNDRKYHMNYPQSDAPMTDTPEELEELSLPNEDESEDDVNNEEEKARQVEGATTDNVITQKGNDEHNEMVIDNDVQPTEENSERPKERVENNEYETSIVTYGTILNINTFKQTTDVSEDENPYKTFPTNTKDPDDGIFKEIKISRAVSDKFNNAKYRMNTAAHGLHFVRIGRAFVFPEHWVQYLKIEMPFFKKFPSDIDWFSKCHKLIMGITDIDYPEYNDYCFGIEKQINSTEIELTEFFNKKYNHFVQKNIRHKRVVMLLAGAALVGGAILVKEFFFNKGNDNTKEIQKLERKLENTQQKQALISQNPFGLSIVQDARFQKLQERLEIIQRINDERVNNIIDYYEMNFKSIQKTVDNLNIRITLNTFATSIIDQIQNLMTIKLDELEYWDKVFISLRAGKIPRDLYNYQDLNKLTDEIEESVKGKFRVGFDENDKILFYNLPLVSYAVNVGPDDKYELYLKIKIPLKRTFTQNQFTLMAVNVLPFPCEDNRCFAESKKKNDLISFELSSNTWLINQVSGKVAEETELSHFACYDAFEEKICTTFQSNLLRSPSACTIAIHDWNHTGMLKHCSFKQRDLQAYRVMPINEYQYIMHQFIVDKYFETCQNQKSTEYTVNEWALVVSVPQSCSIFVPSTRQTLHGPFDEQLKGKSEMSNYGYHSPIIKRITNKFRNITISYTPIHFPEFNITSENKELEILLELNNNQLSELAHQSIMVTNRIKSTVDNIEDRFHTYTYTSTFWGYFALFAEFITMATILHIIFGNWFNSKISAYLGIAHFIIEDEGVYMWEINLLPKIKVLPDINIDVLGDMTAISWVFKFVFICLFTILLLLSIFRRFFRQTRYRRRIGRLINGRSMTPFVIQICIWDKIPLIHQVIVENVYIKVPIEHMNFSHVTYIEVKNEPNLWVTTKLDGIIYFELANKLVLIAYDAKGNRLRDAKQKVKFAVRKIVWKNKMEPLALSFSGNYNLTSSSKVIKEPTSQLKRKSRREAFDYEPSPSAPLLSTEF